MQKKCLTIHQNTGNCLWNLLFSCCMCSPEVKWRLWLQNVFFFFSWLWFIHLYISLSASELHTWLITVDWQTALSVISGGCCGLTRVSKLKRISYQKHFRRLSVCCWAATGGRSVSSSGDSVSVCSVEWPTEDRTTAQPPSHPSVHHTCLLSPPSFHPLCSLQQAEWTAAAALLFTPLDGSMAPPGGRSFHLITSSSSTSSSRSSGAHHEYFTRFNST